MTSSAFRVLGLFGGFLWLLLAWACAPKPIPDVEPVSPSYIEMAPGEAEGLAAHLDLPQGVSSWRELEPVLTNSLTYIRRRPQDVPCVKQPGLVLTWGELGDSVEELISLLPELDRDPRMIAERFRWLELAPGTLLTGYYEPWLGVADAPDGTYRYPLYAVPNDLKTVNLGRFHHRWKGQTLVYRMGEGGIEPYYDREAIDGAGVLEGRGEEIAWAADPVDVFFLQIQGSGRLVYPDGTVRHILYGGKNGHKYVSLGRLLIERGHVPKEEMSMQRIRAFLNANPDTARELMFENPSYVFFELSDVGPFGSIGSILQPRVSVAVDRKMIPLGSVLALKTALADYASGEKQPHLSLVTAQDTGGAIKGTRMDLFCGSGLEAETLAGHLQEDSAVFMLVSKRVIDRVEAPE